jgi:hypothetical protein
VTTYYCSCGCDKFLIWDGKTIECVACEKRYDLRVSNSVDHLIEKCDEFNERTGMNALAKKN